jgi:hypothetical protein
MNYSQSISAKSIVTILCWCLLMISLHFGGWAPHMFLTLYQQRYSPCATCSKISLNFGTATIYIHIYIYQDIPLSESEAIPNDRHVSSSSFHSTEAPNGLTQTAPKCMGVYLQNSALSMYIYIYTHTISWICTHLCGSDVTYTYTYTSTSTCTYI